MNKVKSPSHGTCCRRRVFSTILSCIKDALEVDNNGKKCVMEVAQHIGNDTVRCIMLASSMVIVIWK